MKYVELRAYGPPETAVACVEGADAPAPEAGQVQFEVEAFPINPADVLLTEGNYATKPPLPAMLGAECVGRITAVGSEISDLAVGDKVIHMGRENWAQAKTVDRTAVVVADGEEGFARDLEAEIVARRRQSAGVAGELPGAGEDAGPFRPVDLRVGIGRGRQAPRGCHELIVHGRSPSSSQ